MDMEVVDGMVRGITVVALVRGSFGHARWWFRDRGYLLFPAMFLTKIWTVSSESDVDEESEVMLFERVEGRIVAIGFGGVDEVVR